MTPSAALSARAVARRELTGAIVASARRQLAEIGPAALSVRAVARDLGMASSAVYRYFPSRDDLLTELLVIIYGELADRLEQADAAVDRSDLGERWLTLGRTLRCWALAAPHEYAFLYGSPVPGYSAPDATVAPSGRVTAILLDIMAESDRRSSGTGARSEIYAGIREGSGIDLSDDACIRGLRAWGGLLGAISLELFGHLHRAVLDYDAHFELIVARLDPSAGAGQDALSTGR
ncbi:TetR/AcrR family transcriptional regulator [Microlunatus ginsengisoli]|uniref:TetR/AcrR family transcriptional regulator n=1 Tax=Microlunatus ginsengisoli TaxID=363863 RepID=A0ABP6ZMJ3_9ACTN